MMDENLINTNSAGTPRPSLCDLCRGSYKDKEPKLLPCLHTFCKACIQTEKSDNGVVKCPTCKQECGTQEIVDDYFMLELVTSGDTPNNENKEMTCTNCEDNALARSFCLECTEWLCDACVQAHQRVRVTKDHIVQLRSELQKNESLPISQRTLYCHVHKQETLKLFCESCDKLTCRDCQLADHKEHKYQFVHEASSQHKLFLKTLLQKILEKKTYIEREKNVLNQRFSEITQMQQRVMEDIKTFTLRFVQEINNRGKQLLSDLNLICGNQKALLGQLNTDLNSLSQKLDHCMKFAEQAIESGSDLALLYSKKIITNQLRNILRSRCGDPDPPNIMDIRFTYETNMSTQYFRRLGNLIVNGRHFRPPGRPDSINETNVPNNNANNPLPSMPHIPNMDSQMRSHLIGRLQTLCSSRGPNTNAVNIGNSPPYYPPRLTHMPDGSPNPRATSPSNNTIKTSHIFFPPSGVPHNQAGNPAHYNEQQQHQQHQQQQQHQQHQQQQQQHQQIPGSRPTLIHHHPNPINRFGHPDKNQMMRAPHPNVQNRMMNPGMNMMSHKPGLPTQRLTHYPPNSNSGNIVMHQAPHSMPNSTQGYNSPVISSYYSMARSPRDSVSDRGPTSTTQNRTSPAQSPSSISALARKPVTLRDLLDHNMEQLRHSSDSHNSGQQCNNNFAASSLRELLEQPCVDERRSATGSDAFRDLLDHADGRKTATGDSSGTASSTDSNKVTSSMPVELSRIKQEQTSPGLMCSSTPGIKIKEEKTDDDDIIDQCTKEVLNELCGSSAFVSLLEATNKDPSSHTDVFNLGNMLGGDLGINMNPMLSSNIHSSNSMMIRHHQSLPHTGKGPRITGLGGGGEIKNGEGHSEDKDDPSDDYCACCHNGGDLLCCDTCPRVYHLQCHIPCLNVAPSGTWSCGLCKDVSSIVNSQESNNANISQGKRKAPSGLTDTELKICERVLLELFCHESSPPFHEPVSKTLGQVPNYYKIITKPMDMSTVKSKLSRAHFNHYNTVNEFVADVYLIFSNCTKFNSEFSEVGQAGRLVEEFFDELLKKFLPEHIPTNKQPQESSVRPSSRPSSRPTSRDSSSPNSETSEGQQKKKKRICDVVHYF